MPRICTFCTHEKRQEYEQLLLAGKATQEWIAEQLGCVQSYVHDHMKKHVESQVAKEAAPDYIKRAAARKVDKIKILQYLLPKLRRRAEKLLEQDISLQNERALQATVGELWKAVMHLAKLEGEIGPQVQVNVMVQVKEQLVAMLNLLPPELRSQAYVISKEKGTI